VFASPLHLTGDNVEKNISYYETIHEKEEKCSKMVGHNTMSFEYEKEKGDK
jgi:hypothetical protein